MFPYKTLTIDNSIDDQFNDSSDMKKMWKGIRSIVNIKQSTAPQITIKYQWEIG